MFGGLDSGMVAAVIDTAVLGAGGTLLLIIFGYLFKELRRKDEGVWAIIADRDRRINELERERSYWRRLAIGDKQAEALEHLEGEP